jgi:hypothetical protein
VPLARRSPPTNRARGAACRFVVDHARQAPLSAAGLSGRREDGLPAAGHQTSISIL